MLVNFIQDTEKSMMAEYIRAYGLSNRELNTFSNEQLAPIDYILREWDRAKSVHLYRLLGEQFIVEKKISYSRPAEVLCDQIREALKHSAMGTFSSLLRNAVEEDNSFFSNEARSVRRMLEIGSLRDNAWGYNSIDLAFKDKKIRVNTGCKIMKILKKVAKIYNLETEFEAFRIEHSQILNQKTITGTLCLSIHPFDYMTMSDNDYDWDSCMSWENDGCYRQGTVEMLNSEYVLVAYLKGERPFYTNSYQWEGNKKWRELFVVHPNAICNIKEYPYNNETLTDLALEWIRELAGLNLGWDVSYDAVTFENDANFTYLDNRNYRFLFEYNFMYDDFNTCGTHHKIIIPQWDTLIGPDVINSFCIVLSGVNICMCCGELWYPCEGHENQVLCRHCDPRRCCSCCGEEIDDEDEVMWVEDDALCGHCYQEYAGTCVIDEEHFYQNDLRVVYLAPVDDDLSAGVRDLRWCYVHKSYIGTNNIANVGLFQCDSFKTYTYEDGKTVYYVNMSDCDNYTMDYCFNLWGLYDREEYRDDYKRLLSRQ